MAVFGMAGAEPIFSPFPTFCFPTFLLKVYLKFLAMRAIESTSSLLYNALENHACACVVLTKSTVRLRRAAHIPLYTALKETAASALMSLP